MREAKEWLQREHPGETITEEDVANEVDSNDESSFYAEVEKAVGYERVDDIARELMAKQIEAVKKELTVENVFSKAALSRAYGKPLADMVGALSDAVRYGRFKEPTGIAIPHEVNAGKEC